MTVAAADAAGTTSEGRQSAGRGPVSLASAIGAAAVVWGLAAGLGKLSDNSFFTHLATGRLIFDRGIPRTDPYSFTAHGQPWVVQSWLVSTVYGWLDRSFGAAAIVVTQGLLTAAIAAVVWRLTRPAASLIGRILATGLVLAVGSQDWVTRPLTVGLLLFAVVVLIAERDGRGAWWLLPLGWVWVNAHGSFPFGAVYLVVRLAGRALDRRGALGGLPRMVGFAAAGLLLGAVSPLGPRLLLFPIHLLGRREVLSHVVEWQSPSFSQPVHLVFLAEALLALLLLMRRRSWEDGLVAVVFTGAALLALRNIPLATVALVPVLARGLQGVGSLTGEQRGLVPIAATAVMGVFGVLLVANAWSRPAFELHTYPVRELTWMEQQGLLGK